MNESLDHSSSYKDALELLTQTIKSRPQDIAYLSEQIPSAMDSVIESFIDWYLQASEDDKRSFSESLTPRMGDILLVYSERAAIRAVREHSGSEVHKGLTAIAMLSLDTIDFRECLIILALHHHSAARIGVDFEPLLTEVAQIAGPQIRDELRRFARREDVTIESMGYVESTDQDGFTYRRTW